MKSTRFLQSGIGSLVILILWLVACGPTDKELKEQAEEARLKKARSLFAAMVSRHNASIDWDERLDERLFAFSIDVQRTIASKVGQPIVVFGTLRDVYLKNGTPYILVEYDSSSADVFFVLETPDDLLRSITSRESTRYDDFAFVLQPLSTSVPLLRVFTELDSEEVMFQSSDAVIVQGHLVDLLEGITAEQVVP
jgi:hypothetical protein